MMEQTHILAEGLSPGTIFAIFFAILIAVANILAKSKQSQETQDRMKRERQSRQVPLPEILREEARQQRQPKKQAKKQKGRAPSVPPPMPIAAAAATKPPVRDAEPIESPSRQARGETARNIRLMLQPAGIREALILSEVLGKPKSLRDE